MKKLSFISLAFAAMLFAACGGNKNAKPAAEEEVEAKSFEQEQIEASVKMHLDSLSASLATLKKVPFLTDNNGTIELSKEEKQVKPEYLIDPATAENAATLAEKYRMLSLLTIDKKVAALYEMPVEAYDEATTKLMAEINDPSFKAIEDQNTVYETTEALYNAMNENGRINYFWQMAATSLVEELYIASQNTEKFLAAFDDEAASKITFRLVLVTDAITSLVDYDEEIKPIAEAIEPLKILNAISVEQLKAQLAEANEQIVAARKTLAE